MSYGRRGGGGSGGSRYGGRSDSRYSGGGGNDRSRRGGRSGGPYSDRYAGGGGGSYRSGRGGRDRRGGHDGGFRRGGGGGGRRKAQPIARFHDTASDSLHREVLELNQDSPGPQQIRVLKFHGSHWEAVESLTRGNYYYHNREEEKEQTKKPSGLRDERVVKMEYRPYTVTYAARPTSWPTKKMRLMTLKTNSFLVTGPILDTMVYQYEVTFDPPIESENVSFREKVVLGGNVRERRRNGDLLRKEFGEFQFDNHALYAMGSKGGTPSHHGPVLMTELHSDYKVAFYRIDSFKLSDPNIPIQQQESLLNIFNRQKLQSAGYTRIGRGWFLKSSRDGRGEGQRIPSPVSSCPDVNVISGFECSMRILPMSPSTMISSTSTGGAGSGATEVSPSSSGCLTVFKADLSHKLVEYDSVNVKLLMMRRNCRGDSEFREMATRELVGKHFLLSYNKKNLQIERIDMGENENSTFELQRGGRISYKDYLKETYGCKSTAREMCVIRDRGDAAYLPQHMRLTLTSKQTDVLAEQILDVVNPSTKERLNRIEKFVESINGSTIPGRGGASGRAGSASKKRGMAAGVAASGSASASSSAAAPSSGGNSKHESLAQFEIEEDSLTTPAMILEMPRIIIRGERGPMQPIPVDELNYRYTRGFLGKVKQLKQWGVIYEDSRRGQDAFTSFANSWEMYCGKRRFDPNHGPILEPQARPIGDLMDTRWYDGAVKKGDQFIVLILPEGMRGSEAKARLTKHVQSARFFNPVKVQCLLEETCKKRSACINVFEDIMIKVGNVPYRIVPRLPNGDLFIDVNQTWVCGMDVSHVKNKPSAAMMSLSRDPFEGSLRSMHFCAHLNPCRKEIVAFENMVSLFYELICEAYEATKREGGTLPKNIFVFRDGVADGQLAELFTKEVVGIQRALAKFREDKGLKKLWKPSLEYILCNKNTIDRFGAYDDRTGIVRPLEVPCVVYDHVLSYRLWDFIIYPFHKAKKSDRTRGVRYIVLLDQLKLAANNDRGSALDLFQFIFGLTYMFAFSIPFPLGGTAQPAPVQYAKHYAESFSQMIFAADSTLSELLVHHSLDNRPKIVTSNVLARDRSTSAVGSAGVSSAGASLTSATVTAGPSAR